MLSLFIFIFSTTFLTLIWLFTYTLIHEITHYVIANHYHRTKCIILLFNVKKEKVIYKNKNLFICKTPRLSFNGLTLLENNYQIYNTQQIKKIAIAPRFVQIIYYIMLKTLFNLVFFAIIKEKFLVFLLIDFIFVLIVIIFSLRKGTSGWTDINIYRDPAGYLNYTKTSLSEDETYEYWRNLLCI